MNKVYLNYVNKKNYKYFLLTFDDNYILPASELILSIKSNTSYEICFIIMAEHFTDDTINQLKDLNVPCIIYYIDRNIFDLKKESKWPYIIFAKLIAPFIIEEEMEYLYYMDCDFLCISNINTMYDLKFDQSIAMCPEISGNMSNHHSKLCDPKEVYLNCGFVIYNFSKFKERYEKDNIIDSVNSMMDDLMYYEQDFVNIYFKNDIKLLNQLVFNNQIHEYVKPIGKIKFIIQQTMFIHFSWKKPWNNDCLLRSIKYYRNSCRTKPMYRKCTKALILHLIYKFPRFCSRIVLKVLVKLHVVKS